ncbi:hypothetical protein [Ascidiimonas sp. W6]|uniref:hypothetical protein n=1 Tax=Ascidiimonas meishanensis TaxID=3128903 RepID=UPI0030EDD1D2
MFKIVLINMHVIAAIVWVGSVFMGTFIDWPAARASVKKGTFPFQFIIGQGRRVFYSVYTGIGILWFSGIGLVIISPPTDTFKTVLIVIKIVSLLFMTGFTLYGTFFTWPKMQLATHEEAFRHYKFYMYRAVGTFSFGIIASLAGLWLRHIGLL